MADFSCVRGGLCSVDECDMVSCETVGSNPEEGREREIGTERDTPFK